MHQRDLIMVSTSFVSMTAGVFLPGLAEPLSALPRLILMFMLFISFLAVGGSSLLVELRARPGVLLWLTFLRLMVLPLLALATFRLILPEFSLAAFLLAAAPVGVMAAVFSLMLKANTALILVGNIATSLLLPLSLPALLAATDSALRRMGLEGLALPAHFSLGGMAVSLAIVILLPFALACLTRASLPRLTAGILQHQFFLLTVAIVLSNLAIFSKYAHVLRQSPDLILRALLAACLLCLLMSAAALPAALGLQRDTRLALLISCGIINNVLLLIVSMEFFSVTEALMSAAYLAPLYILLFYYRRYSQSASARG